MKLPRPPEIEQQDMQVAAVEAPMRLRQAKEGREGEVSALHEQCGANVWSRCPASATAPLENLGRTSFPGAPMPPAVKLDFAGRETG